MQTIQLQPGGDLLNLAWHPPWRQDGRGFRGWVRSLRGQSGIYVVRDGAGVVRYVGESHTGRLYETMTRHLQRWTGYGAGPWYARGSVEVAAVVMSPELAREVEAVLLVRWQPADNERRPGEYSDAILVEGVELVEVEGVPF